MSYCEILGKNLWDEALVTAGKVQALNVLIDKLPEPVRLLCVPVLGSGQQERMRLEQSIDRISRAKFGISEYNPAVISQLEEELDEIRRTAAAALNELRRQREVEKLPLPTQAPAEAGTTLAELAAWLHREETELGYIPDPIPLGTECPISEADLLELAALLALISESDSAASLLPLPDTEKLPDAADLIAAESEHAELEEIFELQDNIRIPQTDVGATDLRNLETRLQSGAEQLRTWAGTWQGRLDLAVRDDAVLGMWRSLARQLAHGREKVMALRALVQAHVIGLPPQGAYDHNTTKALKAIREQLRNKGRLGVLQFAWRAILKECNVDGQMPRTAEHVGLVLAASELHHCRLQLANLLNNERAALGLTVERSDRPEEIVSTLLPKLEAVLEWRSAIWPELRRLAVASGCVVPAEPDVEGLERLSSSIKAVAAGQRLGELDEEHKELAAYLATMPYPQHSPLWEKLAKSLETKRWEEYGCERSEALRLSGLTARANRLKTLLERLTASAPHWAAQARATDGASLRPGPIVSTAWRWRELATWFDQTTAGREPSEVEAELRQLAKRQAKAMTELVAAKAWTAVVERIDGPTQVALGAYTRAHALAGQRFSKFAPMYQRQVRAALEGCRHAVPVWIMPVERALADFRCERTPPFDIMIVDEASQIPITQVPVLGLARRVIVVGDDKQMSPSTPGLVLQPIFDLIKVRLADVPKADTTFHPNSSLYDAALTHFPRRVKLTEHFRCLTEIISFSNGRYYGDALVPLRDQLPSPGWVPTHSVLIPKGYRDEDDCNRPEAEYAAALIATLIKRTEYDGKTFGVISLLGKNQSKLIYDLLFDRLGPVVMSNRQIRVGEPAVLQGDERDIIVISTVVSDSGGRNFGAMTKREHQQMINVAASRARDQMWVLHSVPVDAFSQNDERAALIRHCTQVRDAEVTFDRLETLVDPRSPFEPDVLRALIDRGYRTIRPQHRVGRYHIDFVIEGPHSRLALECDGDRHHGPEKWEEDRARQEVLERAGWTFVRVRGSGFYRNPVRALQPLWDKLDELGIHTGEWRTTPKVVDLDLDLKEAKPKTVKTPPESLREKETEATTGTPAGTASASPIVSAAKAGEDPWCAAFSAADKALRLRVTPTN